MINSSDNANNLKVRIQRVAINITLLSVSTVVAMILVEMGLRLWFYGALTAPRYNAHGQLLRPHPTRGSELIPGATAVQQNVEYSIRYTINSKGFRDSEHAYDKAKGVYRVVLLGDSYMEGYGVTENDMFAKLLEDSLSQENVEVINLGIGGYGTVQELILLREEGFKYEPDLVLVAVYPFNDLENNSRSINTALYGEEDRRTYGRPYATWSGAPFMVNIVKPDYERSSRSFAEYVSSEEERHRNRSLRERSLVLRTISDWRRGHALGWRKWRFPLDPNLWYGPMLDSFDPSLALDSSYTSAEYAELIEEAWQATTRCLLVMKRECEAAGIQFAMFHVPVRCQIDQYFRDKARSTFPSLSWDFENPSKRLEHFVKRWEIPFCDLYPTLLDASNLDEGHLYYQIDDQHWTPRGHRVAADEIKRFLIDADLVPG